MTNDHLLVLPARPGVVFPLRPGRLSRHCGTPLAHWALLTPDIHRDLSPVERFRTLRPADRPGGSGVPHTAVLTCQPPRAPAASANPAPPEIPSGSLHPESRLRGERRWLHGGNAIRGPARPPAPEMTTPCRRRRRGRPCLLASLDYRPAASPSPVPADAADRRPRVRP